MATEILHVNALRPRHADFKPRELERAKQAVRKSGGRVIVWVHPYYSQFNIYGQPQAEGGIIDVVTVIRDQVPEEDYCNFINGLERKLIESRLPIIPFIESGAYNQVSAFMKYLFDKANFLFRVPTYAADPRPALGEIYFDPRLDSGIEKDWSIVAKIFLNLGIRNITFVGEVSYFSFERNFDGSSHSCWEGCVADASYHLARQGFQLTLDQKRFFPAGFVAKTV